MIESHRTNRCGGSFLSQQYVSPRSDEKLAFREAPRDLLESGVERVAWRTGASAGRFGHSLRRLVPFRARQIAIAISVGDIGVQ
jgi:hypothetical protein